MEKRYQNVEKNVTGNFLRNIWNDIKAPIIKGSAIGLVGLTGLLSSGFKPIVNYMEGLYNGHLITISEKSLDKEGIEMIVYSKEDEGAIIANDYDGDKRFDNIMLNKVKKGDELENYVPLDSLNNIYGTVKRNWSGNK